MFLSIRVALDCGFTEEAFADSLVFARLKRYEKSIPDDLVVIGEVGLGGEVRAVTNIDSRLKEIERLGFKRAIIPYHCMGKIDVTEYNLEIYGVNNIKQAITLI